MPETMLGGGDTQFPPTQWSMIMRAKDFGAPENRDQLQELLRRYWKPVYAALRRFHGLTIEDAKDVTQDFFATMLEREFLKNVTGTKGTFRSFLKAALKNFMTDTVRRKLAQKRGGGRAEAALDVARVESLLPDPKTINPEDVFDREWRRTVLELAGVRLGEALRVTGKARQEAVFRLYLDSQLRDGADLTYEEMAKRLGASVSDVRNDLHQVRAQFQREVMNVLRESAASEEDLQDEVRSLFAR